MNICEFSRGVLLLNSVKRAIRLTCPDNLICLKWISAAHHVKGGSIGLLYARIS